MLKFRVTYIIRELVENYAAHPQYIDGVDWFFMPLVNPDGYEFAHTDVRNIENTVETFRLNKYELILESFVEEESTHS